jgi:hypothetical protein
VVSVRDRTLCLCNHLCTADHSLHKGSDFNTRHLSDFLDNRLVRLLFQLCVQLGILVFAVLVRLLQG